MMLRMSRYSYRWLMAELARRGEGRRESGAFLLGRPLGRSRSVHISAVAFYDDLDSDALSGGIDMHGDGYARVGEICRRHKLQVVGDIHTHPSGFIEQSTTDSHHPMVAIAGHVAMIVPRYALGQPKLRDLGVHIYLGDYRWNSLYRDEASEALNLSWLALPTRRVVP